MTAPENVNKETKEELQTVNGLQFKPYQLDCIKVLAQIDKYEDLSKWARDKILLDVIWPRLECLNENYEEEIIEKLRKERYSH